LAAWASRVPCEKLRRANVHPGVHHPADDVGTVRGGANGANDLGFFHGRGFSTPAPFKSSVLLQGSPPATPAGFPDRNSLPR
jgi:hypothetical protein